MRSQDRAISHPPANAGPFTAAIRGLVRGFRVMPPKPPAEVLRELPSPAAMALRSAPAENTGPAPVTTPAHTSESPSSLSMAASMPAATSAFTAFLASGRLMRINPTRPRTSYSTMAADVTQVSRLRPQRCVPIGPREPGIAVGEEGTWVA